MNLLGPVSLLLFFFSVFEFQKRVVKHILGFLLMDCVASINALLMQFIGNYGFGCRFWVFGNFKQPFEVLGVFLLFGFGLKVLKFIWFCKPSKVLLCDFPSKSDPWRDGICAKNDPGGKGGSKISSCAFSLVKCLDNLSPAVIDKVDETESVNCDADTYHKASYCSGEGDDDDDDDERYQHYDEDSEFDVLALRKLIKVERRRANSALLELEKDRMSAATAAEESMAMILRLQNEKSLIEMESNQYKRLVEEKLIYYQELIQSLKWLVMEHESDRTALEDQLELSEKEFKAVHE